VGAGVLMPPPGYLAVAAEQCRRSGALLVLDESRIALGRTGTLFASTGERIEPDLLVVGESLAAGLFPIAACLSRRGMWEKAFGLSAPLHVPGTRESGSSVGALGAAAAIATIEILARDRLADRAARVGAKLGIDLRVAAAENPLVHTVRGRGLLWGIELKPQAAVRAVTLGMIDRLADPLVARRLVDGLRERGFVVEPAELDPAVVRISPPLTIEERALAAFAIAVADALGRHAGGLVSATIDAVGGALMGRASRLMRRRRDRDDE
jgi:acetylornithine/succinyldiaminopimelate/putrescine aminotransferase